MEAAVPPGICCKNAVENGLAMVLRTRLPLPFHFFRRWELHNFHTSKWTRVNPSAQIKRTRLGRSCIDQPTMEMVSVSRYGGYTKHESLVTAFRVYCSVNQSDEARRAGQEVMRAIELADFTFDDEEGHEVAIDFACLYLNATVLFGVYPPLEMMSQLLTRLAAILHSSLHWECVLCALLAHMRSTDETVATKSAEVFFKVLREAPPGFLTESLSHNGGLLMLLATGRALALLPWASWDVEDHLHLVNLQLGALEMLCATRRASISLEEHLVVVDTVCWRHATCCGTGNVGSDSPASKLWSDKVMPLLHEGTQGSLEALSVLQCAKLFCALCVTLAIRYPAATEKDEERQWQVLDPLVRHLDQRVRVHSIADMVFVFCGLLANRSARLRYRRFPTSLLDHLREQKLKHNKRESVSFLGGDDNDDNDNGGDSLQALTCVLSQLSSDGEDDLAGVARAILISLSSATQRNEERLETGDVSDT